LIVKRYDFEVVRSALYKQFQGVQGTNWSEVAERLARYGQWEFEDYQPSLSRCDQNGA
jgi:Immunity protein 8